MAPTRKRRAVGADAAERWIRESAREGVSEDLESRKGDNFRGEDEGSGGRGL